MNGVRLARSRGPGYRADIDGLRAVAVISVVLYHINESLVPGGFTGVDIFFVISGYLITRNIWGDIARGHFSLVDFYVRRVRRIAPAYLVVLAATLVAGAALLLPDDMVRLARSALWSTVSLSNVYFWKHLDTGYFAEAAGEEPLLHLWSLGVEEQFYFVWPALLLVAALLPKRRKVALAAAGLACVLSFWNAQATQLAAQKWAYYMLPARGGELMIGALLAIGLRGGERSVESDARMHWLAEALGVCGFALAAYGLFGLDDHSAFPGLNALFPCLGAAMLIFAGGAGSRVVRAVLTPAPMVYIGLISYSLYLWHWPVLAFLRYFFGDINFVHGAFAAAFMVVAAVLSYRYVETPARQWRVGPRRQVLALYAVPSGLVACIAVTLVVSGGLPGWINGAQDHRDEMSRLERYTAPAYRFSYNCQLSHHDPGVLLDSRCVIPEASKLAQPGLLLWGDSQAAHYIGVIAQVAKQGGFAFRNATHSACPPVFGGDYGFGVYKPGCSRFRPYIQSAILSGAYRTVVLGGAWETYDQRPGFREDFRRTLDAISARGVRVVIIGQVPRFNSYNRACELRALRLHGVDCRGRFERVDQGDTMTNQWLANLARAHGIPYVDIRGVVCRDGTCSPYLRGKPVYFDASHLSMEGSWAIGEALLASADRNAWISALSPLRAAPVVVSSATAPAASFPVASLFVDSVRFGRYVEPKTYIVGGVGTHFKVADHLFAAVLLRGTAKAATVKVRVVDSVGRVVAEQIHAVAPQGRTKVNFDLSGVAPTPISTGSYTAETILNGRVVNASRITVE